MVALGSGAFSSVKPPHLCVMAISAPLPSLLRDVSITFSKIVTISAFDFLGGQCRPLSSPYHRPFKAALGRRIDNLIKSNPRFRPSLNGLRRNARHLRESYQLVGCSLNIYDNIIPLIGLLFKSRRPLAVGRLIVPIYIDSVYRKSDSGLSHIRNEIGKNLPSIAYFNPSASVVFPTCTIRTRASSAHGDPRRVTFRDYFIGHIKFLNHDLGMNMPHSS